MILEATLSI